MTSCHKKALPGCAVLQGRDLVTNRSNLGWLIGGKRGKVQIHEEIESRDYIKVGG